MELISIGILFTSALIGGISSLFLQNNKKVVHIVVIIGGAYLLGFVITHLFPEIFLGHHNDHQHELDKLTIFILGSCILGGILIQKGLEYLTTGIEHGHAHLHGLSKMKGMQILLGLVLHSLLEGGILIHDHAMHGENSTNGLLVGIILHKTPAAFILGSLLKQVYSNRMTLVFLLLFAISSPVGFFLGQAISDSIHIPHDYFNFFFAMVAGNFIHIAYNVLTEADPHHEFSWLKWFYILIGFGLAAIVEFV